MKLALPHTIFEPVETHFDGFGAFHLDGFIFYAYSSGVVCMELVVTENLVCCWKILQRALLVSVVVGIRIMFRRL